MMECEGLKRLRSGNFNSRRMEHLDDGTVIITLHDRKEGKTWRFRVRDLYGPDEEVLEVFDE